MNIDIEAIRARAEAATPLVLEVLDELSRSTAAWADTHFQMAIVQAALEIKHAREDIPALIAEVERLGVERDAAIALHKDCASELNGKHKQLATVTAERDEAVEDLREAASELTGIGTCVVCKFGPEETFDGPHCGKCTMGNCQFEWRGERSE